jgi:hypothetical protein
MIDGWQRLRGVRPIVLAVHLGASVEGPTPARVLNHAGKLSLASGSPLVIDDSSARGSQRNAFSDGPTRGPSARLGSFPRVRRTRCVEPR